MGVIFTPYGTNQRCTHFIFFLEKKICAAQDLEMLIIGQIMQFQTKNSVRILNIYVKLIFQTDPSF